MLYTIWTLRAEVGAWFAKNYTWTVANIVQDDIGNIYWV